MIEKNERGPSQDTPAVTEDEDFLSRWSRRKIDAGQEDDDPVLPQDAGAAEPVEADEEPVVLTDEDMPPLEALDDDADYSAFLSSGVSEQLRKQALRKLFHAAKFNICDGLDDYADDYTKFEPLGDVITADMKFVMEQAMKIAMAAENDETAADESGAPAEEVTAEADTLADGTTTEQPGQDEEAGPEEDENARPA